MKISINIQLAILLALTVNFTSGQTYEGVVKYRVTAYKDGDNAVFSRSNESDVYYTTNIYIPNAFTPNGDDLNDTFGISGNGISDFTMRIFNRWGEMIFETNDVNYHWDGTHEGRVVQNDVYVYQIYAMGTEEGVIQKTGKVTVLR